MLRGLLIVLVGLLMLSSSGKEHNFALPMDMSVVTSAGIGGVTRSPQQYMLSAPPKYNPHLYFVAPIGEKVGAVEAGRVVTSKYNKHYGNYVEVAHNDTVVTRYFHLSERYVTEGQLVNKGQLLGAAGSTGLATGPHLKLYIKVNDHLVHPYMFFPDIKSSSVFKKW